jgi:hypothetical protein
MDRRDMDDTEDGAIGECWVWMFVDAPLNDHPSAIEEDESPVGRGISMSAGMRIGPCGPATHRQPVVKWYSQKQTHRITARNAFPGLLIPFLLHLVSISASS